MRKTAQCTHNRHQKNKHDRKGHYTIKEVYDKGRTAKNLIPQGRILDLGWNTDQQGEKKQQLPVKTQPEATVTQTTPDQGEGPPSSWLQSKTNATETSKHLEHLDPSECNLAKMNQQNAILEVNQVQTAPKARFGWQAVLLLTIAVNLLTTLFLCFRL